MDLCTHCPLRPRCTAPCAQVEAVLPKEDTARFEALYKSDAQERLQRLHARIEETRMLTSHRHLLTTRQRRVFDLYYHEALSIPEIAKLLGVRVQTIDKVLQSARRRIGEALDSPRSAKD